MCGIFGIFLFDETASAYSHILIGLTLLQHRGQDAVGISTSKTGSYHIHKNTGLVESVFGSFDPSGLPGNYGIGHVRYSTTGNLSIEQSQPLFCGISDTMNQPIEKYEDMGILIAHNGNITSTAEIEISLRTNKIPLTSGSDSKLLLVYFSWLLHGYMSKAKCDLKTAIFLTVEMIITRVKGSFSTLIMIPGFGLVAFRDRYGIRPLCYGKRADSGYAFSSESVAFDPIQYELVGDVLPGECIIITGRDLLRKRIIISQPKPCLFEYIYFSRPESIMNDILVYQARKNMGEALARKIQRDYADILLEVDVVMPVPDSARISALRASYVLNKPYCEGLIKNNYIGRTFIMPSQEKRKKSLKMKLTTINQEFRDKTVLLIDDSIVRGNTSIELIRMAKNAGTRKVILASIAPPVAYPNIYGIAIPTARELIANTKTNADICSILGCDYLIYNDLGDVIDACLSAGGSMTAFETSCFDGIYL